jgi:hypothetical protein
MAQTSFHCGLDRLSGIKLHNYTRSWDSIFRNSSINFGSRYCAIVVEAPAERALMKPYLAALIEVKQAELSAKVAVAEDVRRLSGQNARTEACVRALSRHAACTRGHSALRSITIVSACIATWVRARSKKVPCTLPIPTCSRRSKRTSCLASQAAVTKSCIT